MSAATTTRLRISRGGDGQPLRDQDFDVPFVPGASVLDALLWIRDNVASDLAFRFACINANVCKECVMSIDGKNAYACTTRLVPGIMVLKPVASKQRVRDLVCDTVPPREKL